MVSANDVDRLFLQAVLSRGLMSTKLARVLWQKSVSAVNASNNALNLPQSNDDESWIAFMDRINGSIDKLDLQLQTIHDELSGNEMCSLVNLKGDEIAQLATDYTPVEIAFFKAIVEQIMLAPREAFSVSSIASLRELHASKLNMTKSQAEVVLASFVAKGWLIKSRLGRYSLASRSLMELQPYLKSTYPDDLLECTICTEILTRGVACSAPNCKVRMHAHCLATFRRSKASTACPSCNKAWPKDKPLIPVGEEAAREGDDRKRRVRIEGTSNSDAEDDATQDPLPGRRLHRRKNNPQDDSMEVGDGNSEQEEAHPTQTQVAQRTRRSKRR